MDTKGLKLESVISTIPYRVVQIQLFIRIPSIRLVAHALIEALKEGCGIIGNCFLLRGYQFVDFLHMMFTRL